MNEVEKMYELAQPEKRCDIYGTFRQCPHKTWECEECTSFVYRPFTAEKQIELIKWLAKSKSDITICYSNATERFAISKRGGYCVSEDFATALAIKINLLWQDLTDAEKAQIKEILSE